MNQQRHNHMKLKGAKPTTTQMKTQTKEEEMI